MSPDAKATGRVPLSRIDVDGELRRAVSEVLDSGTFVRGPQCRAFEAELRAWCGRRQVVLGASGTSIAMLALAAAGLGEGHEVLVPAHAPFATVEAILRTGAEPVFVDVDEATGTVDPADLAAGLTPRTQAIVAVHVAGHPCDMDAVLALARDWALFVLEDCTQAPGATYKGRLVGTLGHAGAFGFHPASNLPMLAEGGCIATDGEGLADEVRRLRDHGRRRNGRRPARVGENLRFEDEIQAAIGRRSLRGLEAANERRRAVAARYSARLADVPGIRLPVEREWARAVYSSYVIRCPDRDALARTLEARGIEAAVQPSPPCHLEPAILEDSRLRRRPLPGTDRLFAEALSLPIFPGMDDLEVDAVGDAVADHGARKARTG